MSLNEIVRYRISNLGYTFKEFCDIMDINSSTMASSLHKGRLPKKNREDVIKELDLQDRFPKEVKEDLSVVEALIEKANPYNDMVEEPGFGEIINAPTNEDINNVSLQHMMKEAKPYIPIRDMMVGNFNTNKNLHPVTTQNQYGFAGYIVDTNPQVNKEEETTTTVASTEDDTATISILEEGIMDFHDIENILSMMDNADYEKQISLAKFICMITGKKFTENLSSESISGKLDRLNLIRDSIK